MFFRTNSKIICVCTQFIKIEFANFLFSDVIPEFRGREDEILDENSLES